MAWPVEPSFKAGGTVAPSRFVVMDPTADEQILQASIQGQATIGVMQDGQKATPGLAGSDSTVACESGDTNFKVHGLGSVALIEAGATFSAGDEVMTTSLGKATLATAGYYVAGIALQGATSGKKVLIFITRYQKSINGSSGN